jgi:hypothetical protein
LKQLFLTFAFLLLASPALAQQWTGKHAEALQAFYQKFGLPSLNNDDARAWTFKLGQQFAFEFPEEVWGTKKGDPGRPQSTDVIARQVGGELWGYDVIRDQGIASQKLIVSPGPLNVTGQVFIPTPAQDHVGRAKVSEPPSVPTTETPTGQNISPSDVRAIVTVLQNIERLLQAQVMAQEYSNQRLAALEELLGTDPSPTTLLEIKNTLSNFVAEGSWFAQFNTRLVELKTAIERKRLLF